MGILKSAVSSALRIANPNASAAYDAYKTVTSKPIRPPTNTLSPAQNASAFSLSKQGAPSQPQGLSNTSMTSTGALPPLRPPSSGNGAGGGGGGSWGDTPTFNPPKPTNAPNLLGPTASSPYYKPTAGIPKPPTTQVSQAPMRPPVSMSGYTSTDPAVQEKIKAMQSDNTNPTSPTTPPATPPVAPTTPSTTPPTTSPTSSNSSQMSREDQLAALQKAYLDSLNPSSDQTDVEAKLRDIAAQQANLNASEQLGLNKIKDQAIPMDLLVGQGASLQRQVEGQQGALTAQATPLEAQLASIQARRAAAQQATKDSIGFEQDRLDREQKQNAPIEVGGNLVRRNADGSYEAVYQAPPKPTEGFNLGPGEQRFDATGKLIASGAPKSPDLPASYREWQLAGSPGTYQDWAMKTGAGAARPLSADQAKLIADGNNLSSVLSPLSSLIENQAGLFGPLNGRLGAANPYDEKAQSAQAQLRVAAQTVGKYLEGGVLRKEDEDKYAKMLPQLSDTPENAKNKLAIVSQLIQQKQQQYLNDFGSAGFNTSGFSQGQSSQSTPTALDPMGLGFNQESQTSLNGDTQKVASAIGQFESGGNYKAIGPKTKNGDQAYGKYQIMGANIPQWSKEALGYSVTPQQFLANPQIQDAIAHYKIGQIYQKHGTVEDTASVWFSGQPLAKAGNARDVIGTSVPQYAKNVRSIYNSLG